MAKYIDADRLLGDLAEAWEKLAKKEIDSINISKIISEQPAVDVGTSKTIKIKRIRAYLRKSYETCEKCKYKYDRQCLENRKKSCASCKNFEIDFSVPCYCARLEKGEPCKHFERAV